MKIVINSIVLLLSFSFNTFGGGLQNTNKIEKIYSVNLQDSVEIEIHLPIGFQNNTHKNYPVIYLLDKQFQKNYNYNLATIEYLTAMQNMPESIVVGIAFDQKNRTLWTSPNENGGKADDLLDFITNHLDSLLKSRYQLANFNLLIGHSRTAIFSAYALSKRYDYFNGAIASSAAYFDFGDEYQKKIFDHFTDSISSATHKYFFYFSSGEKRFDDLHEESVDALDSYLSNKTLPKNFQWRRYKFSADHNVTPGLTVNQSLVDIFKNYSNLIIECFGIVNDPAFTNEVPWSKYFQIYNSVSTELGMTIIPEENFYFSIASSYENDYEEIFKTKKSQLTLDVLLKAFEFYPNDYDITAWIAELYYHTNQKKEGEKFLNKTFDNIQNNSTLSQKVKTELINEIKLIRDN